MQDNNKHQRFTKTNITNRYVDDSKEKRTVGNGNYTCHFLLLVTEVLWNKEAELSTISLKHPTY